VNTTSRFFWRYSQPDANAIVMSLPPHTRSLRVLDGGGEHADVDPPDLTLYVSDDFA
jgi:hypothetical protein